jgi:hypothetical protein
VPLAASLFIDSQSLIGDVAFLDLAMVKIECLFQRAFSGVKVLQRALTSASAGNLTDSFVYFSPLGFFLQSFQLFYPDLFSSFHICLLI